MQLARFFGPRGTAVLIVLLIISLYAYLGVAFRDDLSKGREIHAQVNETLQLISVSYAQAEVERQQVLAALQEVHWDQAERVMLVLQEVAKLHQEVRDLEMLALPEQRWKFEMLRQVQALAQQVKTLADRAPSAP